MIKNNVEVVNDTGSGGGSGTTSISFDADKMADYIQQLSVLLGKISDHFDTIVDDNLVNLYSESNWSSTYRDNYVKKCSSLLITKVNIQDQLKNILEYLIMVYKTFTEDDIEDSTPTHTTGGGSGDTFTSTINKNTKDRVTLK